MKNNRSCNKCLLLSQSVRRYCRCNKQKADGNINDHLLPILHMKNRIRTSLNALYVYQISYNKACEVTLYCRCKKQKADGSINDHLLSICIRKTG